MIAGEMILTSNYIGRFAPSPTGPLHQGSLTAALASYLDARHHRGSWLLRIEDLDPPRESASAPAIIIEQLLSHGFAWDGEILYQSTRLAAYQRALASLKEQQLVYPCDCARKSVGTVYQGTCRTRPAGEVKPPFAYRLKVGNQSLQIDDRLTGSKLWPSPGDFIVKRKDGLFAYQLAVVVDDGMQHITQVVRGLDLLDSTVKQVHLAKLLGLPQPEYMHVPLVLDDSGDKLSKQTHAPAIENSKAMANLNLALAFLGQQIPAQAESCEALLELAIKQWDINRIPTQPPAGS